MLPLSKYSNQFFAPPKESSNVSQLKKTSVLICYGNGADLGDMSVYANFLKDELSKEYDSNNIQVQATFDRAALIDLLETTNLSDIEEIHIICHAIGAGLYLGYHMQVYVNLRQSLLNSTPNPNYDEVVKAEIGALLTDHLFLIEILSKRDIIRDKLKSCQFIKIWGCNSGVTGHVYSSNNPYWAALNTDRIPKPAIAQAIADFANVIVKGATSGSHLEYRINGIWVSGYKLSKIPQRNEYSNIRLNPDRGFYYDYNPNT